jgi:hypothetical protein
MTPYKDTHKQRKAMRAIMKRQYVKASMFSLEQKLIEAGKPFSLFFYVRRNNDNKRIIELGIGDKEYHYENPKLGINPVTEIWEGAFRRVEESELQQKQGLEVSH